MIKIAIILGSRPQESFRLTAASDNE